MVETVFMNWMNWMNCSVLFSIEVVVTAASSSDGYVSNSVAVLEE